jgi:phosphoribosylformimino-5-aminoimidazole carboxamide ribonucleotide (ProFAR) isomerase
LGRLTDSIRSLEQWYAADFERRVAGLTEVLKNQITEELRAHYASELNAQVDKVQKQYEERLSTQTRQWEMQRESLMREIDELRRKVPNNDVMTEIAATEAIMTVSVDRSNREFERMAPDAASLGRILQARIEELETKAYLRGLKFRLPDNL